MTNEEVKDLEDWELTAKREQLKMKIKEIKSKLSEVELQSSIRALIVDDKIGYESDLEKINKEIQERPC